MYFGPHGSGTAAKLVNQALVAMHAQAACEALYLAQQVVRG
jgi:3-hydroxyisobutyrate dehydrogenase-like beta-hydroxyacid dehydrogenase